MKKCSACSQKMERGYLGNHGMNWLPNNPINTAISKLVNVFNAKVSTTIIAWKCNSCKKVELEIGS